MTGWLPKEILDHLAHAGYVAIPKERVRELYVEQSHDRYEVMRNFTDQEERAAFRHHRARLLAAQMGHLLIKENMLEINRALLRDESLRERASVIVLAPRTVETYK